MVLKASHSGLRDWVIQRISAIVIGLYTLFVAGYLFENRPLYFAQWQTLFHSAWVQIATGITLIAVLWHAWIGLWTVLTDYIKISALRLVLQTVVLVLLLGYLLWGIEILNI